MKQLSLLPTIDKETEKKVQKEVINILKEYRALKIYFENAAEQKKEGVILFSRIGELERFNRMKFEQIEKVLQYVLDEEQRNIIVAKYLSNKKCNDDYIYDKLLMNRDKYYKKKKNAFWLIAISLGIM
ncbi:ArpU family transcriptional regulator [Bacillus gaemokensis]|uniref:ArpU family transcriptional regulator n=1 Tax=Bacillus gaemokensis TaxID=574375 RepID=A0A073KE35_9BACI|nr:ArpU family transcriptional regulator [Bacillus gaemokensis]KEK24722.1 ArpU family transcriptional regulator [Bacillus gaemokensis]KYG34543.1 ArpU family transcriptional regulator [Bacillus gaemokensis]